MPNVYLDMLIEPDMVCNVASGCFFVMLISPLVVVADDVESILET